MESFGLFNFLKSAFSPPPSSDEDKDSKGASSFFDPAALFKNLFSSSGPAAAEKEGEKETVSRTAPPPPTPRETKAEPLRPEPAVGGNNPFLTLMERHERLARDIDRKSPRR